MAKIKPKCVIIGAGTYGQVYKEYLSDNYKVIGFFDDDITLIGKTINNTKVIGSINDVHNYIKKDSSISVFVIIGNNDLRVKLLDSYYKLGYKTPSFIHKSVFIHHSVVLNRAIYILPGSNIMPLTIINNYVMVSMGVNIAHHVIIETGCFLSQGSNIGASILIKQKSFIGIASTIMTGVSSIGEKSTIGAGAVIIKDVPDGATVVGNPGKIIKSKQ